MGEETDEGRRKPARRDWAEFIRIWQASTTVKEVCDETGYKDTTARRYAWSLRKRGVELRRQDDENPQRSNEDWKKLRQLAAKLAGGEDETSEA